MCNKSTRGGSWYDTAEGCRSAKQFFAYAIASRDGRLGFRAVKEVEPSNRVVRGGSVMSIKTIKIEAGKDLEGDNVAEFEIGETVITQAQWCSVTGSLPQAYLNSGGEFDPKKPVTHVSYHDAMEFCKRLSEQTGENYRLPTGQEWEFACRAGTTGDFSCPKKDLEDFAVFDQESIADVATKLPNGNGLYDMHGNVWEWTQD